MKSKVVLFFLAFLFTFLLSYSILDSRTYSVVDGVTSFRLVGRCELEFYDTTTQPMTTLVLACPRMDMVRLWPFPIIHPWFEDWHETPTPPPDSEIAMS